jgi:hypothetical protein
LAVVSAVLLPLAATSQIAPDRPARHEAAEPSDKYEIFAGYGYTSLNQVNQSENGLQGVNLSLTRKHFGLTADGGYYAFTYDASNPGNPTVDMVLLGPVFRARLFEHVDGFVHVLLGGVHTSTDNTSGFITIPKLSFAGGAGGGVDYKLNPHFAIRLAGDDIASSFVQEPKTNPPGLGYSPHLRRNARVAFGVVYRF